MTIPKDQPCTGPVEAHECVYTKEIFPGDEELRKMCHCCQHCAWECGENI